MNTINYQEYIIHDPQIMLGKPCIKGTRLTVELVLRKMSQGAGIEDLLLMYPYLTKETILSVLLYAKNRTH